MTASMIKAHDCSKREAHSEDQPEGSFLEQVGLELGSVEKRKTCQAEEARPCDLIISNGNKRWSLSSLEGRRSNWMSETRLELRRGQIKGF